MIQPVGGSKLRQFTDKKRYIYWKINNREDIKVCFEDISRKNHIFQTLGPENSVKNFKILAIRAPLTVSGADRPGAHFL